MTVIGTYQDQGKNLQIDFELEEDRPDTIRATIHNWERSSPPETIPGNQINVELVSTSTKTKNLYLRMFSHSNQTVQAPLPLTGRENSLLSQLTTQVQQLVIQELVNGHRGFERGVSYVYAFPPNIQMNIFDPR